jgi:hypothetical protein
MPDLNHKFNAGKMNKDLDERLVPNGEYRDALNAQVTTSEGSDIGSLQNILGNLDISSQFYLDKNGDPIDQLTLESYGFYCVGSINDEKNDKLYWLVSGIGIDFIAEYNYKTKQVFPIIVDVFQASLLPGEKGRVLHFDKSYLITGINIIEETLFWTDNNTEPKKINIPEIKIGTYNFLTHTEFFVPNPDKASDIPYVSSGPVKHEHLTIIKKGPQIAPKLEMKNTTRDDIAGSDPIIGEVQTTIEGNLLNWFDQATGMFTEESQPITFSSAPDFKEGDKLVVESVQPQTGVLKKTKLIIQIESIIGYNVNNGVNQLSCNILILSYDQNINLEDNLFNVYLLQDTSLFEFRFPRFACRYKYKDGEYSAFSPFTEVGFLPSRFDYLPKEGYNLGMVNTVRSLGVCNFVDERSIPEDVVSIDILYKESDSPNIYSIKNVERVQVDTSNYDSWNAISPSEVRDVNLYLPQRTYGYVDIEAEMIHSLLPSNQLLRTYDNVPRKALAQEVIGNRLVYANYLQNYNMSSRASQSPSALSKTLPRSKNIEVDLKLDTIASDISGSLIPEQINSANSKLYNPAKTIKSLRTYQLGVVYIDEYGRETPVFSESKTSSNTKYVEKIHAPQQTKLKGQVLSAAPDFAKSFKFLIKETSSEYYNLAMDRWYPAEDGNIWLSFPSSDRNKVDLETFLILKKSHDGSVPITDLAKYKILDIDNEVPTFVKVKRTAVKKIVDDPAASPPILMTGGITDANFPYIGGTFIQIEANVIQTLIDRWNEEGTPSTDKQFRLVSDEGASDWYNVKEWNETVAGYWRITADREFGVDMSITTPFNAPISSIQPAYEEITVEFIKREAKILPEFEGRFFVKILKDATLQEHIVGYTSIQNTYTSINQFQVQYINPTEANTAPGGVYDPSSPDGYGSFYGYGAGALGPELGKISIDDDNEATGMFPNDCGDGDGLQYWRNAGATNYAGSNSSGWFIDKVEAFRPYSYNRLFYLKAGTQYYPNLPASDQLNPASGFVQQTSDYQADDLTRGLNTWGAPYGNTGASFPGQNGYNPSIVSIEMDGNGGYNPDPSASTNNVGWNHQGSNNDFALTWNINPFDAVASRYQGRKERQLQLIGDCTHFFSGDTPQGSYGTGYLGFSDVATPASSSGSASNPGASSYLRLDPDLGGGKPFNNGLILPAVGCPGVDSAGNMINGGVTDSDGSSIITLSFAGLGGTSFQGQGNSYGSYWNNDTTLLQSWFQDGAYAGNYVRHVEFVNQITTPGTIWRWKEDPDQVVYQTLDLPSSATTIAGKSVTTAEWDHNQFDLASWQPTAEPGIGLFNYTKIHDYVTYHYHQYNVIAGKTYWRIRANWATQGIGNYKKDGSVTTYADEASWYPRMGSVILGVYNDNFKANRYPMFTSDFETGANKRRRFFIRAKVVPNLTLRSSKTQTVGDEGVGGVAPHFYSPTNDSTLPAHYSYEGNVLDSTTTPPLPSTPAPGIRPDGMYSGHTNPSGKYELYHYNLTTPALKEYTDIPGIKMTDGALGDHSGNAQGDTPAPGSVTWQILEPYTSDGVDEGYFSQNPGVWETEPKDDLGLEIYHEVGQIYPIELNETNLEQYFGPVYQGDINTDPSFLIKNSKVTCWVPPGQTTPTGDLTLTTDVGNDSGDDDIRVKYLNFNGNKVIVALVDVNGNSLSDNTTLYPLRNPVLPPVDSILKFTRADGSSTEARVKSIQSILFGWYEVYIDVHNYKVTLPFFNAYSFGNGVESNRIRDDFNQVTIDKGPKVSAVLEEPYAEEHRKSGLIYSGIYNSMSGINNLNQFIQAEKITKDLNPIYGSIQKLFARNTDLVTFCEDKVFKILAQKDALFNADGNINLTATENVLGQTIPFAGDYGISTNPESFAEDSYRLYFTDRTRGSVLRLSQDGITPISNYGMLDWFADNLPTANRIIGSFDDKKGEYNLSLSYKNYNSYPIKIKGTRKGSNAPVITKNILEVRAYIAEKISIGDEIVGAGIPIGTTVVSKTNLGAGIFSIQISQLPDVQDVVNTLGKEICGDIDCIDLWWNSVVFFTLSEKDPKTLSYSEVIDGWPSFKSFHKESGLSLNNEYFTFKGGLLYQHHANELHNNFYGEQYESSVELLFNEQPGSVKSFQTINYEGTQSKITSDGGLNETSYSGEYWDNYDKLGWYVDNMYTDLQEAEPAEFKNKEGKWFSTVKGVATEWLDDGTAGNIDTREFSYQGIDEVSEITVVDGGYTSYDCLEQETTGLFKCTEVEGLDGAYIDEAACLADPNSKCNLTCQVPNIVTAHKNDYSAVDCKNPVFPETLGNAAVEVYLAGGATSWTVKYYNAITNTLVLIDPSTYSQNGFSTFVDLLQGDYYAVVEDSLGCTETVAFSIECASVPAPCQKGNPHTFIITNVQNPQWMGNRCWEPGDPNINTMSGSFYLTNMSLASPATSWNFDLYLVSMGSSILIESQFGLSPNSTHIINGLQEGTYEYIISDSEDCVYSSETITLVCATQFCDPPVLGQSSTSKTMSSSQDGCITDNSDGTHDLINAIYPGGTGSYYVTYFEYDNTTYSTFPGPFIATQLGATTGPFGSVATNVANISNLSASNISGKNYAVMVSTTPALDCFNVGEFTIECDGTEPFDPCVGENNMSLGPKVTGAVIDATSYDCNAAPPVYVSLGSHTLTTVQIQAAAQGFTVEYFSPAGFNITAQAGGVQSFSAGTTMVQANGHDFLMPGTGYTCVITDNLGCSTTITFAVDCKQLPPADPIFNCNDPINGFCGLDSTGSAVNNTTIFSSYAACIASNCYQQLFCTGVPWVGCCVTDWFQNGTNVPSPAMGDTGPNGLSCYADPCCECCGPQQIGTSLTTLSPPHVVGGLFTVPHASNQNGLDPLCQSANWDNTSSICTEPACFTKNDLVEMFDGTLKAISKIKIGEEVKSIKNGKIVKGVVTETLIHPFNNTTEVIKINDITAEPQHPVYIDGKWIPIKDLSETTYEFIDSWYNLEIDGNIDDSEHNYIIGGLIASGLGDNEKLNNKYQRQPKQIFNL